jgi:hypothetical protein
MLVLVLAATAAAATAIATDRAPPSAELDGPPPAHRNGIAFGLSLGAGLGGASGYPNDSQDIGDPQFYSAGRWMPGTSESVLAMGALADYLNFGFWFSTSNFRSGGRRASGVGVGVRVEAFPLLALYPRLDGLGFFAQFGVGTGKLTTPSGPEAQGSQSIVGTGAFYEWALGHFLGGHIGIGPSLEYDAVWSLPFEEHGLVASARVVFYGAP